MVKKPSVIEIAQKPYIYIIAIMLRASPDGRRGSKQKSMHAQTFAHL